MAASPSWANLLSWRTRTDPTSHVQPGLFTSCRGTFSSRTHILISLVLLLFAAYADYFRPFDGSWSIIYLVPVCYAGMTLRGRHEILIYLAVFVSSFLVPYFENPELFRSSASPQTRSLGALIGMALVVLIWERRGHIDALQVSNTDLECRVAARTSELERMNRSLQAEILEREKSATTAQQLELELRQAQKLEAIGALAGGVAHDFNNLLTVINGYSSLVFDQLPESSPQRTSVEEILKAGERAAELSRQLLTISRKQVFQPTLIEINRVLARMEGMLKRVVHENIRIRFDLSPIPCTILADESRLIQILLNLACNAQDAMPEGGDLHIGTSHVEFKPGQVAIVPESSAASWVRLSVVDTGYGMDESTRMHLFEPFFTTKSSGKGTGLGLASVYGIVKQVHGYITVDSKPGQGTRFDLYFPFARQKLLPRSAPAQIRKTSVSLPATILLVDDNPAIRNFVSGILRQAGHQVLEAGNGVEALELLKETVSSVDLLISDVVMPEMGGPALVEKLAEKYPHLKVLYMSGYSDSDISLSTRVRIEFLPKPFNRLEFQNRVNDLICPQVDVGSAR